MLQGRTVAMGATACGGTGCALVAGGVAAGLVADLRLGKLGVCVAGGRGMRLWGAILLIIAIFSISLYLPNFTFSIKFVGPPCRFYV